MALIDQIMTLRESLILTALHCLLSDMSKLAVSCFCLVLLAIPVSGQDTVIVKKAYTTQRAMTPPVIDGALSDEIWESVEWGGDFVQLQPYEGEAPTQDTRFKILYDDQNLYIGYRCYDTEPEDIVSRMSRRDGFSGDWIEINIDSYNDQRTAFSFTASVSGVKSDEFVTNDGGNWDTNWNPIWTTKSQIDSLGWTCEVEIPLSQLRFNNDEDQVWGIQFTRRDFRNESRSVWQFIPRNSGYWVSGFGELNGISDIKPKRQIEIQPYVLAQTETYQEQPGNPFADGSDGDLSVGLDGKVGLTNDLTLDFTINPDFGQVEADPSALTLDGFQIFFQERRPFFVENRNIFNYNISNSVAGGAYDTDNIFYSRRIGSRPHHRVSGDPGAHRFADQPEFTTILGAAKISGKTKSGLSLGIIESITQEEKAVIDVDGERSSAVVEPLTNYFVGRAIQDFNKGKTVIGVVLTGVNRRLEDTGLDFLHKTAQTGGVDILHRWKDRAWSLTARFTMSRVSGSIEAIQRTQNAFEHNFRRPGADHLKYDPAATSLVGQGGDVALAERKGKFRFQSGITWRSPKLELNDIGFMRNTDEINHYHWMGVNQNDPKGIFRNYDLNYNHWLRWDFGGDPLYRAVNFNASAVFTNFWSAGTGTTYENLDVSNNWLRGGPQYRKPAGLANWIWFNTDSRKDVRFFVNVLRARGFKNTVTAYNLQARVTFQPTDAINFSLGPSYNTFERVDQYVSTESFNGESRYILAHVDQRTLSITARLDYNITPDLTIQYYGQPFISRGTYRDFNFVIDASAAQFVDRVTLFNAQQVSFEDDTYYFDENSDGITDYSIGNPEFNFVQFRSNLVARWEYIPGSEVFLVWTQSNTVFGQPTGTLFDSLTEDVFGDAMRNTFLVKLTYRFLNR